ncbi:acyltransferase family protein [Micromonospora siamensis]|uniref:Peptidoglycan/LPS O-acetylase OafA/YrhL, contains acyltransferase and SGNH-hydrolase domains n=1 Tax=Micromonospora siamensis TaxID=299152 RepID=A0A1C5GQ82_9ACTN|nr:acyltransferase family protein [Micromonospora siamensis]SCG35873.1 Peptidoglycan/LPS O-acetylase OafA/YrhL, contains acyltransferase and SGNH-hydrolase domains [Micromonospora siamensis]
MFQTEQPVRRAPADAATQEIPAEPARSDRAPRAGFRPDIEGLRSIAVLLVVLSHAGLSTFAGGYVGVDVFFVISGFLITSLLMRELARTGRISIAGFYARRAVRLLPASSVVLLATLAGSWLWLSPPRSAQYVWDAVASATYWVNIRLAVTGTDYLAAEQTPSPFQHFWSLAVEEQFYLVWPLLILAAVGLARLLRVRPGWTVAPALVLLSGASFWLSTTETTRSAPWAYFGMHTRAWELGLGALVALGAARLARLPRPLAALLTWAGLAAVLVAALRYDESTSFPGTAAALPVLGTVAIIGGGCAAPRFGVEALLRYQPWQLVGKLSYGWYLWHWPVLMIAPVALLLEPSVWVNLALSAGALVLAGLSLLLVENPVRHRRSLTRRPGRGISLGLGLGSTVVAAALLVTAFPPQLPLGRPAADPATAMAGAENPGTVLADLMREAQRTRLIPGNLTPSVTDADDDLPVTYTDGCHLSWSGTRPPDRCFYGDPDAKRTMVLFGDSHAAHWFPGLDAAAKQTGWRLLSMTKSGCPATSTSIWVSKLKRTYSGCDSWRSAALTRIEKLRPELVVVASSVTYGPAPDQSEEEWTRGWDEGWGTTFSRISQAADRVALIGETPVLPIGVQDCLAENPTQVARCARPKADVLSSPELRATERRQADRLGVQVVDPVPWLCPARCAPLVGNVLVYHDTNHLTATFSRLLAPLLTRELRLAGTADTTTDG